MRREAILLIVEQLRQPKKRKLRVVTSLPRKQQ